MRISYIKAPMRSDGLISEAKRWLSYVAENQNGHIGVPKEYKVKG